MKLRYLAIIALLFISVGVTSVSYMPDEGTFAFGEVENYTLHDINFTVPVDYELKDIGDDFLVFKHDKEKLKINVTENGKIKKVNSTKNVTAGKTMMGSQEGYLVDRNGSYTFSYKEGDYLVTIKSKKHAFDDRCDG